jgi:hypothetical protein
MRNTDARDKTQIVSKYGPDGQYWNGIDHTTWLGATECKERKRWYRTVPEKMQKQSDPENANEEEQPTNLRNDTRAILMVDKLWLWILGGGKWLS